MIDTTTSQELWTKIRKTDGRELTLVMSDEFETPGRLFSKGKDKLFEAIQKPDYTNEAIQFCKCFFQSSSFVAYMVYYSILLMSQLTDNSSSEYVTTADGSLVITARAVKTTYTEWDEKDAQYKTLTKNYTSGMVQSWNKFCFTGGILEMSIELPGEANSGGIHLFS